VRNGFIGGLLVIGSSILLGISAAIGATGGSVSVQGAGAGGLTVTAALILLGLGAAVLSVGGPAPLNGRLVRLGLGLIAIGLLATLTTATQPSESVLIYVFLAGGAVSAIGVLITALALLASPGRPRIAGSLFAGGLLVAMVGGALNNSVGPTMTAPFAVVGGGLMLVALASIGLLGMLGDGQAPVAMLAAD
jgi:hypothetical protein